jgi:hypothetical protein
MKTFKFSTIAFVLLTTFTACSKSNNSTPAAAGGIEGIWSGTYDHLGATTKYYYSFNIKAGGIIEELSGNGTKKASGTWKLEGNTLIAEYTNVPPSTSKYAVLATFDKNKMKLSGTWGYGSSDYDGGYWTMTK